MISTARNISRDYKLPERYTVQGSLFDNFFDNHIKNQCENLLNWADIYGLHFQGGGKIIKDTPLLNILAWVGLPTCVSPKYCGLYRSHYRWSQEGC